MLKIMKLDWTAIKCYHSRLFLLPVALLAMGAFSATYLVPMGVVLMFFVSVNLFLVEEKGELNRLYLTLPMARSRIVTGRYLLSLLLFAAGLLMGFLMMPLANLFARSKWYPDWRWMLALGSAGFLIYALLSLAMYPVLFRLGYQKGKIWGYYVPSVLFLLGYLAFVEYDMVIGGGTFITGLLVYAAEHILAVSGGILLLGAAVWVLSWRLSVGLYARREF